jgi:hypothetical protein
MKHKHLDIIKVWDHFGGELALCIDLDELPDGLERPGKIYLVLAFDPANGTAEPDWFYALGDEGEVICNLKEVAGGPDV